MRIVSLKLDYHIYSSDELSSEDQTLIKCASDIRLSSYSPYSNFKVGAAALLESGMLISAANQENASYPLCICAEQSLLSLWGNHHSQDPIVSIAIVAGLVNKESEFPVSPCGACRQVMVEVIKRQNKPFSLLLSGTIGLVYRLENALSLLPLQFDGDQL